MKETYRPTLQIKKVFNKIDNQNFYTLDNKKIYEILRTQNSRIVL